MICCFAGGRYEIILSTRSTERLGRQCCHCWPIIVGRLRPVNNDHSALPTGWVLVALEGIFFLAEKNAYGQKNGVNIFFSLFLINLLIENKRERLV